MRSEQDFSRQRSGREGNAGRGNSLGQRHEVLTKLGAYMAFAWHRATLPEQKVKEAMLLSSPAY